MKSLHCLSLALMIGFSGLAQQSELKNGDIIFIKNKEIKGKSLLPVGKSKFNYVGIVFLEKDGPVVYHAMEPLTKCSVDDFLKLSDGRDVVVKHLAEEELLTDEVVKTMRSFAEAKVGSAYDNSLKLSNDQMYNAEFIWKVYQAGIGVPLCIPREIKEYKVENQTAIEFLTDAYGTEILDEKIVAVGDIFQSQFLE
jgi:hypothetical protein